MPSKEYLTPSVLFETYEAVAERRLPTARLPNETQCDAFGNGESHTIYRLHVPRKALKKTLFDWEIRREVTYLDERRGDGVMETG